MKIAAGSNGAMILRRSIQPLQAIFATALAVATPARAQVIEIDEQGVARTRAPSGAVTWIEPGASAVDATEGSAAVPDRAVTATASPAVPMAYGASLLRAASLAAVSPSLLEAVVWQESRWRAQAVSRAGATGLGQLMPATARQLGVDPRDPDANLIGTARYLRAMLDRFDNNIELALAAYNAGPDRVSRAHGIPPIAETRAYVASITKRLAAAARP